MGSATPHRPATLRVTRRAGRMPTAPEGRSVTTHHALAVATAHPTVAECDHPGVKTGAPVRGRGQGHHMDRAPTVGVEDIGVLRRLISPDPSPQQLARRQAQS
jgi:hypothetical protein